MKLLLTFLINFTLILSASSADYYWVGGSGNWSDISHWAATSGGSVTYPTAPTSEDNVIFDANSFTAPNQRVLLTTDIIFFKDMNWSSVTNNPSLIGPENVTLNAFGDVVFSPDMSLIFEGEFNFTGEIEDKTIDFAGLRIPGVVIFNGNSRWTLASPLLIDSMLHVQSGQLVFNNQLVETSYFYITTDNDKEIDLTDSEIRIMGAYQPEFGNDNGSRSLVVNLNNLNLIPGNSRIDFMANNASFYHFGNGVLDLNNVVFSANTGRVLMTSDYFTNQVTFSNLTFMSNARIDGIISADILNLTSGNLYTFASGRDYNFGAITGNANCARGIVITSNNNNFNTNFNVDGGLVEIEYLTLRDVHAVGGATFNANSGVDLGNNDGWTFTNSAPISYYWVGGTGMWTDGAHWSFTSGGPPSGCIPSGKDDVFFDANSFNAGGQSVSLDRRNLYVHDMTWNGVTNNPSLVGSIDFTLNITGSLEFDANMVHEFEGNYEFESNEMGNTIRSNGIVFNQDISFSGLDASWELLDDLEALRFMGFESGQFYTNGNTMTIIRLYSYTNLERLLDISNSNIMLRNLMYRNPSWEVDIENYNLVADNSFIEFDSEGAEMRHRGYNYGLAPEYNNILFNTATSLIISTNNVTEEEDPAIIINNLEFRGRGDFEGSNHIRTLVLANGYDYTFDAYENRRQVIDELITQGTCESGLTQLYSRAPSSMANVDINQDYIIDRLYFRDLNVRGGIITANNSVDGGNNMNVDFDIGIGRTLYWVGNEGLWQEPEHWSLASGGLGGECIPTPIDDVIFDANSFNLDYQIVDAPPSQFSYCRNITWTNTFGEPQLEVGILDVHGSVLYDQSFQNNTYITVFSSRTIETVFSNGQTFNRIVVRGEGVINYEDDLIVNYFVQRAGSIRLNDINATFASIEFQEATTKTAEFGNSQITITDNGGTPFYDNSTSLTIDPGNSVITFTGFETGLFSRSNIRLNALRFPNARGSGYIVSRTPWDPNDEIATIETRSVVFNGNGEIIGNMVTDTLIGSAGKIYTFESEKIVDVREYMQFIGNNCTPIEITSSTNNEKATINMSAEAEVVVDFVQMRNNIGTGGAEFNAGSRSINVGNSNEGWTFEDAPDFIETGFLGNDGALCLGGDIILNAFSYSPGEQYFWNDGSTDSILMVSDAGIYFVQVEFESECILRDTIEIFSGEEVTANLPANVGLCGSEALELNAGVPINIAEYLWNTGSTDSLIQVEEPGSYSVQIDVNGCLSYDTAVISIINDPALDLGGDPIFCENEEFNIASGIVADSYLWSDGTTDSILVGQESGLFWLEINESGCLFRDSLLINTIGRPALDLGIDTSVCEGQSISIIIEQNDGEQILWSDGLTSNEVNIDEAGIYIIQKSNSACTVFDTLNVSMVNRPEFGLDENVVACQGDEVILSVPEASMQFEWYDENEDMDRIVTLPGRYILTIFENTCVFADSVNVSFIAKPELDLGNDTLVCDDTPFIIRPTLLSAGILSWEDGSISNSFAVDEAGTYEATLASGQCVSRDSITIQFEECAYFQSFIPNVFSPNGDGHNDLFEYFFPPDVEIETFEVSIFDRWGSSVFSSKDVSAFWDGRLNLNNVQDGVYTYLMKVTYLDDLGPGDTLLNGDVTVIH